MRWVSQELNPSYALGNCMYRSTAVELASSVEFVPSLGDRVCADIFAGMPLPCAQIGRRCFLPARLLVTAQLLDQLFNVSAFHILTPPVNVPEYPEPFRKHCDWRTRFRDAAKV